MLFIIYVKINRYSTLTANSWKSFFVFCLNTINPSSLYFQIQDRTIKQNQIFKLNSRKSSLFMTKFITKNRSNSSGSLLNVIDETITKHTRISTKWRSIRGGRGRRHPPPLFEGRREAAPSIFVIYGGIL